jgi:hypothetical protein
VHIAPLFLLYDYTWAAQEEIVCVDEYLLDPYPHSGRAAWCLVRVAATRLAALPDECTTVLINHFPLRRAHAHLPRAPRFSPWCGARATDDWARRFRARAVVYGHLHIRRSFEEDGTQFHEVSLGYPDQWNQRHTMASYLRVVL